MAFAQSTGRQMGDDKAATVCVAPVRRCMDRIKRYLTPRTGRPASGTPSRLSDVQSGLLTARPVTKLSRASATMPDLMR
jgi:hypothetical protein